MEAGELELFQRSLRSAVAGPSGPALDEALAGLGWAEALADDPRSAVPALFEELGSANAASSALADVVATALGTGTTVGSAGPAVALPPLGAWSPPGALEGRRLVVQGLVVQGRVVQGPAASGVSGSEEVAVVTAAGDRYRTTRVRVTELDCWPVTGIDDTLGLWQVSGRVAVPTGGDEARWTDAVRLAQLAVGHQLVGSARTMLELARRHSLDRIQFGRPISSFQAVRHRLADALVAVETAQAALDAAWQDPSPEGASIAKALSGRGARTVARHAQQVLAGIGFTAEHPFHVYFKRSLVLDQLFGSAARLTADLGGRLAAGGKPPRLLPL